jgi:hypothetical protein
LNWPLEYSCQDSCKETQQSASDENLSKAESLPFHPVGNCNASHDPDQNSNRDDQPRDDCGEVNVGHLHFRTFINYIVVGECVIPLDEAWRALPICKALLAVHSSD